MTSDPAVRPEGARPRTAVDQVAEDHLATEIALDPVSGTYLGDPHSDTALTDFSPDGHAARDEANARTLRALADVEPVDDVDRVTVAALRERLELARELHAMGTHDNDLNVIASPLQNLRLVFDVMAKDTPQDWATVTTRLGAMPRAVEQYVASLRSGMSRGTTPPRRQVLAGAAQAEQHAAPAGFFATLAAGAEAGGTPLPDALGRDLRTATAGAAQAYQRLADFLRDELLPVAGERDGVGREEYALRSRYFLGATVDLDETYAWGRAELARITAEMQAVADVVVPGGTIDEAMAALDADPARVLQGTAALQSWMQQLSDAAVEALAGTHFDIPEPVRRLECLIAPTQDGGIYYTGPNEDFSRPGRMWWSVPEDVSTFSTWRETTTVYHEGVPGHHLQVGQTVYRAELLNRWRRMGCWISGHGEGWALYAERLMADLGFLDDPGDRMGMLDGQRMRAARVVLDIGVHCGLPLPPGLGTGTWDAESAWRFLPQHASLPESMLRFELDRYLGWPGQAPSYKVGERLWLQARDQVRAREGADFDLAAFHRRALDLGSVGLDVLHGALVTG